MVWKLAVVDVSDMMGTFRVVPTIDPISSSIVLFTQAVDHRTRGASMSLTPSPEREELRSVVRKFLVAHSDEEQVRRQMDLGAGFDASTWKLMAQQIGIQSLMIPEEYGGAGFWIRRDGDRPRGGRTRAAVRAAAVDGAGHHRTPVCRR